MIQMSKNGSDPYSPLRYPILRWPRELNALQIEKNTCKLRKQLSQFYTAHTANAHNTTKKENYANRKKACKLLFFYDFLFFWLIRTFTEMVHPKMKIMSIITQPHVIPNL